MSRLLPPNRPRQQRAETAAIIRQAGIDILRDRFVVVAIRGYYARTMGNPNGNDLGLYDDAIFLITQEVHAGFNANTDPERTHNLRGRPTLIAGLWRVHRFDLHNGKYLALCQRGGPVTVRRELTGREESGMFGINIHKGGATWTGSEGCFTIPPGQWDEFISLAQTEARRIFGAQWQSVNIPLLVIDNS